MACIYFAVWLLSLKIMFFRFHILVYVCEDVLRIPNSRSQLRRHAGRALVHLQCPAEGTLPVPSTAARCPHHCPFRSPFFSGALLCQAPPHSFPLLPMKGRSPRLDLPLAHRSSLTTSCHSSAVTE